MAESARESNKKWTVYDVGGSQSQRGMMPLSEGTEWRSTLLCSCLGSIFWRWYVPDSLCWTKVTYTILVNVIIFLAPMSGFNQVLAEDESVNRLVRTANSLSRLGKQLMVPNNRPIHSGCGRPSAAIRSLLMSNLSCSSTNSIFWKPNSSRESNSHRLSLHIPGKTKRNQLPGVRVKLLLLACF